MSTFPRDKTIRISIGFALETATVQDQAKAVGANQRGPLSDRSPTQPHWSPALPCLASSVPQGPMTVVQGESNLPKPKTHAPCRLTEFNDTELTGPDADQIIDVVGAI